MLDLLCVLTSRESEGEEAEESAMLASWTSQACSSWICEGAVPDMPARTLQAGTRSASLECLVLHVTSFSPNCPGCRRPSTRQGSQ